MRLITISREYGAGGGEVAIRLTRALGWGLLDRELLHRPAQIEHVSDAELEAIDEQAVSVADRFRLDPPHQRYIHGLSEAARQAAAQGNAVLVGRGSHHLVGEAPDAFHPRTFRVRLVAPMPIRLRRVMELQWLAEEPARKRIAESDDRRRRFYQDYFQTDWSDPLGYDITVNSGRLGASAVDLVAIAADRAWERRGPA